jgi:hypothetical protein
LTTIGSYQIQVQIESTVQETAFLSSATIEDMPSDWDFDWLNLWRNTSFECQNIIKLVYQGTVWGLVRYGLYPYPGSPNYLEIEHIEAHPTSRGEVAQRLIEPIGKWLIWYATKVALKSCQTEADDPLIILEALETSVAYYRDKVEMEYLGFSRSTPGEDLYGFRFSRKAAAIFCQRQENEWGIPKRFDE